MDLGLAGQVVLVTGAGQGIGRHFGLAFAAEGSHVAVHYHSSRRSSTAPNGLREADQDNGSN